MVVFGPDFFTWNGTVWSSGHLIAPSNPYGPTVSGSRLPSVPVSCTGARFCMLIGERAYMWNGAGWRYVLEPDLATGAVYALSCAANDFCLAANVGAPTLAWDGGSWTIAGEPLPSSGGGLGGLACGTVGQCEAVTGAFRSPESLGGTGYAFAWSATPP